MEKQSKEQKRAVRIRYKALANGNQSIYLDIYRNGKRQYKFLRLYIVPETGSNREELKHQNAETLRAAKMIQMQLELDIAKGVAGIKTKPDMLLADYVNMVMERKQETGSEMKWKNYRSLLQQLLAFDDKVTMAKVDERWVERFIVHLNKSSLKQSTVTQYFNCFRVIMGLALKEEVINKNPMLVMDKSMLPHKPKPNRPFLEVGELKDMISTPNKKQAIRNAFLFACFTGLRFSDIQRLTWRDVASGKIDILQKKTGQPVSFKISKNAREYIPARPAAAKDTDNIFLLPTAKPVNTNLRKWAAAAGIKKHVTFHTARHTFATMCLTMGVDIYTVSKLLGHTDVATTQIYAEITDKKKEEAARLIDLNF